MSNEQDKPRGYRVDDDDNLTEDDLKRTFLGGEMKDANAPGMEGQGMGGQNFGKNNLTPAGDDKDNPSQNAGNGNAYFNRTQPAEEHPENSNFVPKEQEGEPNIPGPNEVPDQQMVGEGNEQKPHPQESYKEGTADDDGS